MKVKSDHRSKFSNLSKIEKKKKPEKKSSLFTFIVIIITQYYFFPAIHSLTSKCEIAGEN